MRYPAYGSLGQTSAAMAQASPQYSAQGALLPRASPQGEPVSYASVTQLNGLLAQLEATSKTTQADLAKLRIERWKTDGPRRSSRWATWIRSSAICRMRCRR